MALSRQTPKDSGYRPRCHPSLDRARVLITDPAGPGVYHLYPTRDYSVVASKCKRVQVVWDMNEDPQPTVLLDDRETDGYSLVLQGSRRKKVFGKI